jgi:hypothetical protein
VSERDDTTVLAGDAAGRGQPDEYVRLSAHPRAQRSIARLKALGGLFGFLIGLWTASRAGLPSFDTGVHALVGGISGWLLMWLASVQVWRQLALAEFRAVERRRAQRIAEYNARVQQLHDERAEALRVAREALS